MDGSKNLVSKGEKTGLWCGLHFYERPAYGGLLLYLESDLSELLKIGRAVLRLRKRQIMIIK